MASVMNESWPYSVVVAAAAAAAPLVALSGVLDPDFELECWWWRVDGTAMKSWVIIDCVGRSKEGIRLM